MFWHSIMTVQPMVSWGMRRGNIWFFTVCEIYPRNTEASRLVCKSCPRNESTLNNAMVTYSLLFILSVYPWRLNFNILTDFNGIWLDSLLHLNWLRCKSQWFGKLHNEAVRMHILHPPLKTIILIATTLFLQKNSNHPSNRDKSTSTTIEPKD